MKNEPAQWEFKLIYLDTKQFSFTLCPKCGDKLDYFPHPQGDLECPRCNWHGDYTRLIHCIDYSGLELAINTELNRLKGILPDIKDAM